MIPNSLHWQHYRRSMRAWPYLLIVVAVFSLGCRTPIETVMRGAMNMSGGMDMNVEGGMNMTGEVATVMKSDNTASRLSTVAVYANPACQTNQRIAVLDVDGLLLNKNIRGLGAMGENPVALFREKLDALATDPSVAAIVLRINSPGGGVTASDMMTRDLMQLKQQRQIPIVACIMDVGAGGAYYLATEADHIVAHPTSVVGAVGVIFNAFRLDDMPSFSVQSIPVKAGSKVDMGSPTRRQTEVEHNLLQDLANEFHQRFIDRVARRRSLRVDATQAELAAAEEAFSTESDQMLLDQQVMTREAALNPVLDGRVISGIKAMENGLVDQLGYLDDAVVIARQLAGLAEDTPVVMLRRDNDRAYTLLDVTPNSPTMTSIVPLNIPGLDRSQLPNFLYLWQPEPSMATGT